MALTVNLDSQIVVQTAAQWAADATVYSNKRLLVTSDETYANSDQRKFKIANGTDTWSNLDFFGSQLDNLTVKDSDNTGTIADFVNNSDVSQLEISEGQVISNKNSDGSHFFYGGIAFSETIIDIDADTNNLALDNIIINQLAPSANYNLTGMVAINEGGFLILYNSSTTYTVTLKNNTTSSLVNRFLFPHNADYSLAPRQSVILTYLSSRWRLVSYNLVSGSNIKTINGSSIVGSGDLVVSGSSGITISSTTITSGTNTRVLYNNSGVVGEYTLTGSGASVVMGTSPTFTTDITTPKIIGSGGDVVFVDRINLTKTTEQLRLNYDGSNRQTITVGSNGLTTYLAVGTGNNHLFKIDSGTAAVKLGCLPGYTNDSAIHIGAVAANSPTFGNHFCYGDGAAGTYINSKTLLGFTINSVTKMGLVSTGVIVGSLSPTAAAPLEVRSTTAGQFQVGYDTTNYYKTTVSSTGVITLDAVGSGAKFVFSDNIELTQTVTTESLTSDRSVTVVINGTTYKLLAKA